MTSLTYPADQLAASEATIGPELSSAESLGGLLRRDIGRTFELTSGRVGKRLLDCFRSPGVHAMVAYRLGNHLRHAGPLKKILVYPLHLWLSRRAQTRWGIEISKSATIGAGFYIGHFGGITIAPEAVIGENCNISQQVVIGISGQGEKRGVPVIGDNVYLAPGAKLFGKITIGDNSKIGANAVVHKDVPPDSIVVLDPGFAIIAGSAQGATSDQAAR